MDAGHPGRPGELPGDPTAIGRFLAGAGLYMTGGLLVQRATGDSTMRFRADRIFWTLQSVFSLAEQYTKLRRPGRRQSRRWGMNLARLLLFATPGLAQFWWIARHRKRYSRPRRGSSPHTRRYWLGVALGTLGKFVIPDVVPSPARIQAANTAMYPAQMILRYLWCERPRRWTAGRRLAAGLLPVLAYLAYASYDMFRHFTDDRSDAPSAQD